MNFRGKNIDLVGKQNLWFGLSLAIIIVGMVSWLAFGLNLGIDFKGGGQLQYRIPYDKRPAAGQDAMLLGQARDLLEKKGLKHPKLQIAGGNTIVIGTDARDDAELRGQERVVEAALAPLLSGKDAQGQPQPLVEPLSRQLVGPIIGQELRKNAIKGVLLGVLLIAGWIYVRYNFAGDGMRYAVAGIVALVHDVLVLIGLFALIGKIDPRVEVDGSFIAALLTVVGYSINDSVVIFDRLRENLRTRRKEPFNRVVNDSLLETMSRSINTGLTVLIMLFFLLLFGGESIYNFVLAMLVGITSGLYSSIFNASMVLTAWHSYDEKKAAAARAARVAGRGQTVTMRDATRRPAFSSAGQASLPSRRESSFDKGRPAPPSAPATGVPATAAPNSASAISAAASASAPGAGPSPLQPANLELPNGNGGAGTEVDSGVAVAATAEAPASPGAAARAARKARSRRRF